MRFRSHLLAQASGSVAGVTYTRAGGAMVMRSRAKPITASSPAQTATRFGLSLLSARWSHVLTEQQRAQWANYAAAVPTTNTLGQPVDATPKGAYIRANAARQQLALGLAIIDNAPTSLNRGTLTVGELSELHGNVFFPIDGPEEWWLTTGAYLISYRSPPQSAGRVYFNRTFSVVRTWEGDPTHTWPTARGVNSVTPPTLWKTLFFRFAVTYPDGRFVTSPVVRIAR